MSSSDKGDGIGRKPPLPENRTLGENLRKARIAAGFTQQELADRIGMSKAGISNAERRGEIRKEKLFAWAKQCHVGVDDLSGGAYVVRGEATYRPMRVVSAYSLEEISVLQSDEGENTILFRPSKGKRKSIRTNEGVSGDAFAVEVENNDMSPDINAGDMAIVDPAVKALVGRIVLVALAGEVVPVFKRIIKDGSRRLLVSNDKRRRPVPLDGAATVLGTVVERKTVFVKL